VFFRYALYVLDNQNLEETWDLEQHRELQIESGTMFFHINRKLCPKKIKNLGELVGIPESESDVSTANGDLAACENILCIL
jgi:Receptor L domain